MKRTDSARRPGRAATGFGPWRAGLALLLGGLLCLPAGLVGAQEAVGEKIDTARGAIEKWVETQRVISQEKRDLALAKEVLNERIELVELEIESLRGKIAEAEKSIAEADSKRAELVRENDRLRQASDALTSTLLPLEQRTQELLVHLPDPLRERIKPLSQRLPEDPENTKLSLSERFQNVVGILNEVNKSNLDITVKSEVRSLPDGTSAEVTAMYLGIGQAYYSDAKGEAAGLGFSSPEQEWQWTPVNAASDQVSRAIAIHKNEDVASFVPMPAEIK